MKLNTISDENYYVVNRKKKNKIKNDHLDFMIDVHIIIMQYDLIYNIIHFIEIFFRIKGSQYLSER